MFHQETAARFAWLDPYSTQELEEMLRSEFLSADNGDDALVFRILEMIESREASLADGEQTQAAWERFQTCYHTSEGDGRSLYPPEEEEASDKAAPAAPRPRRYRTIAFVAAVVAALMVGMVTAQAAGVNVFGAIARWTEDTFQFAPASSAPPQTQSQALSPPQEYLNVMQTALKELGMPTDLAPTWYPPQFQLFETKTYSDEVGTEVFCAFSNDQNNIYSISIQQFASPDYSSLALFEKDDSPVEEYTSQGRLFYILSNLNTRTAAWSYHTLQIGISGNLSVDELKSIIDSIPTGV